jgi:tRNA-dihydrouridine synthase B
MQIGRLSLSNNVFLAPMAGISNLPFRRVCRRFGCGLAFTEMISANGLFRGSDKTFRYLDSMPEDSPLAAQLFGSDPAVLAEAAKRVTDRGADLVDINMGCPVKKVMKTGAGAALMKEPTARVASILQAVRAATRLPLTVKLRSGWNRHDINAPALARIAEDCGVDAVTIHARTADQGFGGQADWDVIRQVKRQVGIPVIGNGDIRTASQAIRMIAMTGCDGVMVGRGALGNPWIFRDILFRLQGGEESLSCVLGDREQMIFHHLDMEIKACGETIGVRNFRKHLLWYTKGLRGGGPFRQKAVSIKTRAELHEELGHFFVATGQVAPAG